MKFPHTVRFRSLAAKIYGTTPSYPLYRLAYHVAGKRVVRSSQMVTAAKKEAEPSSARWRRAIARRACQRRNARLLFAGEAGTVSLQQHGELVAEANEKNQVNGQPYRMASLNLAFARQSAFLMVA